MLLKEMAENSNLKTCAKRQEAIKPHYRLVARLLRLKAGQEGKLTKEGEIQIAEKLRENVTVSVVSICNIFVLNKITFRVISFVG